MASKTLRRRLHHGDPLLGNYGSDRHSEECTLEELWDDERRKEQLHWTFLFSQLIAQWARWLANIVVGSGSFIGRFLTFPASTQNGQRTRLLTPVQLYALQIIYVLSTGLTRNWYLCSLGSRLRYLRQRLEVPFDGSRVEHLDALKQLWRLAYPDRELPPLKSELWKEMGWQGPDPSTDFRGGGFISLENLIFFAQQYPESFQRLLHKQDGTRAEWEYPFAVAGIIFHLSWHRCWIFNQQSQLLWQESDS
ncbi:hypothetical protein M0R45_006919 [Rubus argutus]|uniref:ELMO domain-containing protein n=1 Tax=Rubus argutus TaxID=59490 RepID=A0AAW1YSB3_RUBAR